MAAFITYRTGNWSDDAANGTSPWNGGVQSGVPGTGDTVTIKAGHTVTVDANTTTGGCVIGSGAGTAALVLATDKTLTLSGNMQLGANVNTELGSFTFGAGSILALGANHFNFANGTLRSNSTTDSWATVTGTGNFGADTGAARGTDIVIEYVSFQNTGTVRFGAGGTTTVGITVQVDVQHCTFVGCNTITFGIASSTALATPFTIDYNDFRNLAGNIVITGAGGDATSTNSFSYDTVSLSTRRTVDHTGRGNLDVTGSVFSNALVGTSSTSGNITYDGCFFTLADSTAVDVKFLTIVSGDVAVTGSSLLNSYCYANWSNAHPIGISGSSRTPSHAVRGSVLQAGTGGGGDYIAPNNAIWTITDNIMIGTGDLITALTSDAAPGGVTANHNTIYHAGGIEPAFWVTENEMYNGTVTLKSNIVAGTTTLEEGSQGLSAIAPQVASADYNCHYNVTTPYKHMTITGATHDLTIDPQFLDNTRDIATWDAARGSTTGTPAAAITHLLALNGYNSGTKTQSDSPITNGPDDLVSWVRDGFKVQNPALNAAGHDAVTIGACDYIATLVIQDSVHAHRSSNLMLSPASGESDLTIPDSVHAHTSDVLTLTTAPKVVATLDIADSVHAHTSDNLSFVSQGIVDLAIASGGTARYDVGDLVRVIGSWHDPFNADAAVDPTVVKCSVRTPSGITTTYVYGTDAGLKKESTGVYYLDVNITEPGTWNYRWWSTGTAQASEEHPIEVRQSAVMSGPSSSVWTDQADYLER